MSGKKVRTPPRCAADRVASAHRAERRKLTVRLNLDRVRTIWYAGGINEIQPRIHTARVDDTPLLLAHMLRLSLPAILDAHVPVHGNHCGLSRGWITTLWLAHLLSRGDHRLNRVRPWADQRQTTLNAFLPTPLRATDLTDDRLADALAALSHDAPWTACEEALQWLHPARLRPDPDRGARRQFQRQLIRRLRFTPCIHRTLAHPYMACYLLIVCSCTYVAYSVLTGVVAHSLSAALQRLTWRCGSSEGRARVRAPRWRCGESLVLRCVGVAWCCKALQRPL